MKSSLRKTLVCFALVFVLALCNLAPAFAEYTYYPGGWYSHSGFSFTDYTLSSSRTVMARYLIIRIDFYKPDWDAGLGDINLTFEIRDADSGQTIVGPLVLGPTGYSTYSDTFYYVDLGYSGRSVRFWFDASSAGTSNGNYRSATVSVFKLYPSNTNY